MKQISNEKIVRILREMAAFYEMEGVEFKPRAYEKAALGIESLGRDVKMLYKEGGIAALEKIPGVGKSIALHIEELLKTGHFKEYDKFKKKVPVEIEELVAIEGVGARMVHTLWKELKIKNMRDLERAARAGKIRDLPGFGVRSEQKILKGIEFLKRFGERRTLGFVMDEIEEFVEKIRKFPEVEKAQVAGSNRRMKETIGDVDILVVAEDRKEVMKQFVELPEISHVYGQGETKTSVKLKNGLDCDIRVVPKESWGAALNYFTGSKAHNIALRKIAIKKGYKLNEYGLWKGKKQIAGRTEEDLYRALGLRYIEPELREMTGEIEASQKNKLPKLIEYGSIKGDLQIQTNWTDGKNTIEEVAAVAEKLGLEYIAITDHTKFLAMTGGADEKKLRRQMKAIDKLNSKLETLNSKQAQNSKFKILKGAEVNIMKDGTLDIIDEVLAELDVVGAAVHSHFGLPKKQQTARVIRAMENPHVDIIFHLTSRIIGRRKPINLDIDEIIKAAKRTKTILEIDAYPDRLDIKDEYIKKCVQAGVKMSINSDAHSVQHLRYLDLGVAQARRGWAEKKDIINILPVDQMLKQLKGAKKK